jgi:lysophospholipase L1-like esterase
MNNQARPQDYHTILLTLILVVFFYFPTYAQANTSQVHFVMLGDSITARGNWSALLNRNDVGNQGVDGYGTSDVLKGMEKIYRIKPKWCLVMIGINDIFGGLPVERIYDNYRKIIDGLMKQKVTPIIQSTLYVAGPDPKNDLVTILNMKIKKLAEERKILYLNLNNRLAPNKQLLPAFTHDGLHLNDAGYQAWKDELLKMATIPLK